MPKVYHKGFGEYSDGFTPQNSADFTAVDIPGCSVADNLNAELGDPSEVLLQQAIDLIEGGTCNAVPVRQVPMARLNPVRSALALPNGQPLNAAQSDSLDVIIPHNMPGRILSRP